MSGDISQQLQGLGVEFGSQQSIASLLSNPEGIAEMLQNEHPQTGDSAADIFADIINVQRADTRKLAEQHGVDLDVKLMEPDRAAELLAGTIHGEGIELVVMFNELAEKRDVVLREVLDEDEYQQFMAQKHAIMHTETEGSD